MSISKVFLSSTFSYSLVLINLPDQKNIKNHFYQGILRNPKQFIHNKPFLSTGVTRHVFIMH